MPAGPMAVTIALAPRHAAALRSFVSRPHAALTPAQFNARYAPSAATVAAVRSWARGHGLRVASVSPNRTLVRLSGSSSAFAAALHTGFADFSSPSTGPFFQITRTARLPRTFAGQVSSVLGLSSLGQCPCRGRRCARPAGLKTGLGTATGLLSKLNLAASSLAFPGAYGPKDFWSMYDAPGAQTGSGQQLSIITEGDVSQPKKDLATFEAQFGLPTVTWNQINVGAPTTDTSGDDEWDLDSQYSTGFAPGSHAAQRLRGSLSLQSGHPQHGEPLGDR